MNIYISRLTTVQYTASKRYRKIVALNILYNILTLKTVLFPFAYYYEIHKRVGQCTIMRVIIFYLRVDKVQGVKNLSNTVFGITIYYYLIINTQLCFFYYYFFFYSFYIFFFSNRKQVYVCCRGVCT